MPRLDALADPFRLAVARYLDSHPDATAAEVAAGVGVHLNTARAHLAALVAAGAVRRITAGGGRPGRPAVRYRLEAGWTPQGDELLSLSSLLASTILRLDADPEELRAVATEWGRGWSLQEGEDSVEARLTDALGRLGFSARVIDGRLSLSGCPCPLVAPEHPALVCALADAVVEGVLEGSRVSAGGSDHDPVRRNCSTPLALGNPN
ncbi:MAG TPA: helix-turn-helix domain-containing protein [Solirubrobacterales bacterium]|nr:helix-turn-helix domain-containing protein [Solirubrobacterales bacterium]